MSVLPWTRWVAVGALAVLAGCTASDGGAAAPTTTQRPAPAAATAADTRFVDLLLYQVDDAGEYELVEATIARCMDEAGFPYDPNSFAPGLVRRTGESVPLAERKTRGFGYASADEPRVPVPDPENSALMNQYGAPWSAALGTCEAASTGILAERQEALGKELSASDRKYVDTQNGAYAGVVVEEQPAWSTCMARAGLRFASQEEMHEQLQAAAEQDGAIDAEIDAAVADDRCATDLWAADREAMVERILDHVGGTKQFGDPYDPDWTGS